MRTTGRQAGFTLIELVVVITILGILAAFAIPRFASLQNQARTAATEALQGSLRSGAALAHAMWLATGETSPVDMEGNSIVIVEGYPSLATIDDTLASTDGFLYDPATGVFSKTNDGTNPVAGCTITYAEATAGPPATPPSFAPDFSGC